MWDVLPIMQSLLNNEKDYVIFFFFFRLFSSIRGSHSVLSFSKAFCFQCPSFSHQLPPYLLSVHLEIFSSASLSPGNSISITLLLTYSWSLLMTRQYHLSLLSLIFIPNRSTLTIPLMKSFIIFSFLVIPWQTSTFASMQFPSLPLVSL